MTGFTASGYPLPPESIIGTLQRGIVIPAHPLALFDDGTFDEESQARLSRYYHAAGAGGVAVGVHTTQFEIREPEHNLLAPVLKLAAETIAEEDARTGRETVLIAGVVGKTDQAVEEAKLARGLGYHAGLLSLAAMKEASDSELIDHARRVAREIPLFGFYLQPAVGGRRLSRSFWREFCEIENVVGIKVAPFNRYATLDVVRGLAESSRVDEIPLYTGNDDTIVLDLLTRYRIETETGVKELGMVGGLLGHWAVWTERAVEILEKCRLWRESGMIPSEGLTLAARVTDMNAALFDAANDYAGCIPGINEVLRQEGIIRSNRCLDPMERMSPGQKEEIESRIRENL